MKKTILVIENDADTLDLISEIIDNPEFEIIGFPDKIPISQLIVMKPDLVILDCFLKNSLGQDYCKEIKANPLTNDIPILLVSGIYDLEKVASDSCADGYLPKPFDIYEFENLIITMTKSITA